MIKACWLLGIEEGYIVGMGLSFMFSLVFSGWGMIYLSSKCSMHIRGLSNCESFSIQKPISVEAHLALERQT